MASSLSAAYRSRLSQSTLLYSIAVTIHLLGKLSNSKLKCGVNGDLTVIVLPPTRDGLAEIATQLGESVDPAPSKDFKSERKHSTNINHEGS
jgi:hypothetical protein